MSPFERFLLAMAASTSTALPIIEAMFYNQQDPRPYIVYHTAAAFGFSLIVAVN